MKVTMCELVTISAVIREIAKSTIERPSYFDECKKIVFLRISIRISISIDIGTGIGRARGCGR